MILGNRMVRACLLVMSIGSGCGSGGSTNSRPGTGATGGGAAGATVDDPWGAGGAAGKTGSMVLTVCAGGGATFTTLGEAIAMAPARASIQVCPGVYQERLSIDGKPLWIIGTAGAAETILDAGAAGSAVTVRGTAAPGLKLQGFTIRAGATPATGAGIHCEGSTLSLLADVVTGNHADAGGGGLSADTCALDVSTTRFDGNQGFPSGGGALLVNSTGEVRDSQFVGNHAEAGGGVAVVEGTVALRRNTIESNMSVLRGGGINHASTGPIADNAIRDNMAGWTGGGAYLAFHALQFTGNTVSNNTSANDGGGIYIDTAEVTVNNNTVSGNRSQDDGGGLRIFTSKVHAEGNVIEDNVAGDSGGGLRVSHIASLFLNNVIRRNQAVNGGGMDMDNDSSIVRGGEISANLADRGAGIRAVLGPWDGAAIEDAVISGNKATGPGGGIALDDNFQPVTLRRLTITGNTAASGGGVSVTSTDFRMSNVLLAGNTASGSGGAIHVTPPAAWTAACPCPPTQATGQLDFLTIFGNTAPIGSALFTADTGPLSIRNSILFQNAGTAVRIETGAPRPVWAYDDTSPESLSGMPSPTGTNGNIALDPLFVDAAGGNFHLAAASPAANAGDPAVLDRDGTRCDLGSTGGPSASSP